jgi:hypothetical protein
MLKIASDIKISSSIKSVNSSNGQKAKTLDGKEIDENGKVVDGKSGPEKLVGKGIDPKNTLARILKPSPLDNPKLEQKVDSAEIGLTNSRFKGLLDSTQPGKEGGLQKSNSPKEMASKYGFTMPGISPANSTNPALSAQNVAFNPNSTMGGSSASASASAVASIVAGTSPSSSSNSIINSISNSNSSSNSEINSSSQANDRNLINNIETTQDQS